jgi:IgA Peptidase M64
MPKIKINSQILKIFMCALGLAIFLIPLLQKIDLNAQKVISNTDLKPLSTTPTLEFSKNKLKSLSNVMPADGAKDRINLIFVFSDEFTSIEEPKQKLIKLLDLSGEKDPDRLSYNLGMFATEPFKSNKEKFNLWYYDEKIKASDMYFFNTEVSYGTNIFDLKYTNVGYIENTEERAAAYLPELNYDINKNITEYRPGPRIEYKSLNDLISRPEVVTHELGHSLFGLADEYVEPGRTDPPRIRYPNCAENSTQAREWWGNLEGRLDPYYNDWKSDLINYNYKLIDGKYYYEYFDPVTNQNALFEINIEEIEPKELYTVGYINGGCFTETVGSQTRPTVQSMMNSSLTPLFGAVSLREINKVLNLFSGNNVITLKPTYQVLDRPDIFPADIQPLECNINTFKRKNYLKCSVGLNSQKNLDKEIKLDIFGVKDNCVGGLNAQKSKDDLFKITAGSGDGDCVSYPFGTNNFCNLNLMTIECESMLIENVDPNLALFTTLIYNNNIYLPISTALNVENQYSLKLSELSTILLDKTPLNTKIKAIAAGNKRIMSAELGVAKEKILNNTQQTFKLEKLVDVSGEVLSEYPVKIKINSIQTADTVVFSAQVAEREALIKTVNQVSEYNAITDVNGNISLNVNINGNFTGAASYTAYAETTDMDGILTSNAINWTVESPKPVEPPKPQETNNPKPKIVLIRTGGGEITPILISFILGLALVSSTFSKKFR